MINVISLEKATRYLRRKGITQFVFVLEGGKGVLHAYKGGTKHTVTILHDDKRIKIERRECEWK